MKELLRANWIRILKWTVGVPVVLVATWIVVLLWFNEFRFYFQTSSPDLAAAQATTPSSYDCPEPPRYNKIEERLEAAGTAVVERDDIMDVWTKEMTAFDHCSQQYLVPARKLKAHIDAAFEERLAISQRDGLIEKLRVLEKHLVPAERMAKRAEDSKTMWIRNEWPEDFLEQLKTEDPASYRLLTGKDPAE